MTDELQRLRRFLNLDGETKKYFTPTEEFEIVEGVAPKPQPKIKHLMAKKPQPQTQQTLKQQPQPQVIESILKGEITVTADSTESEVIERFRMIKADLAEHERQRCLEQANRFVVGVDSMYGTTSWGTQPTLNEEKRRLENSPPKKVERRLQELKDIIERYSRFPKLYQEKIRVDLPCNWRQEYATEDAAVRGRMEGDKMEIVAKAVEFYKELVEATEEILNRKKAFVAQHANELSELVKQDAKLRQSANRLQRQVNETLKKELRGLKEREVKKLVSRILKHQTLEREHDAIAAKIAAYSPDNPTAGLPSFPTSNHCLPNWIKLKLKEAERG